jgi:hypothetical protein
VAITDDDGVSVVTVGETLAEGRLSIPLYQRPYSWTPSTALQLLDDVHGALTTGRSPSYLLGAIILHRNEARLDVVDGQQRLLTLMMLSDLLSGRADAAVQPGEDASSHVVMVRKALGQRIAQLADRRQELAPYLEQNCWLIRVQTDDEDEAFRVFDSQNYRGKALMPHDLLKAYHLREMAGETRLAQTAVVERWEEVPEADLDRLFSSYLYRIHRWSRGLDAPRFTTADIEMFKGLRPRHRDLPSARYHLAAQAAVPILLAWRQAPTEPTAEALHARFQLDAPVTPGRPFFEMVDFVHAELTRLRKRFYAPEWEQFAAADEKLQPLPRMSRYRYVSEMYLAAALYYTNKFGDAESAEASRRLFRWAYALRVQRQRVQFLSVDNLARGRGASSAFRVIRDATAPTQLRDLRPGPLDARPGQDVELAAELDRLETA